jgi:hypothetical protein
MRITKQPAHCHSEQTEKQERMRKRKKTKTAKSIPTASSVAARRACWFGAALKG